jgi:hypothetical protein
MGRRCTVQGGIHTANIDQQTDHSHALRGLPITKQFVAKDLASLTAFSHGVNVQVGKSLLLRLGEVVAVGEDLSLVVEDGAEKVVLDVFSP